MNSPEQDLWQAFCLAFRAYDKNPSVYNWLAKQAAHAAWAAEFLREAA